MNDELSLKDDKFKLLLYIAPAYAFLCAILYLYSFWSRFKINFLEFISLADILKVSLYPMVGTVISIVIGLLIGLALSKKNEVSKKKRKRGIYLAYGGMTIIALEYMLLFGWHNVYVFIPFFIALWLSRLPINFLASKNISVPWYVLYMLILIPLLSYGYGARNSHDILKNFTVRYAKTSQFENNELFGNQSQIKYIGLGGKYYFFISEDNSNLYIMESESIGILELSAPSITKYKFPWIKSFTKEPEPEAKDKK
jgi:hypothetical protein